MAMKSIVEFTPAEFAAVKAIAMKSADRSIMESAGNSGFGTKTTYGRILDSTMKSGVAMKASHWSIVETASASVETASASVETATAPVETATAPVETATAPVETA